jgi:hypothetical protein
LGYVEPAEFEALLSMADGLDAAYERVSGSLYRMRLGEAAVALVVVAACYLLGVTSVWRTVLCVVVGAMGVFAIMAYELRIRELRRRRLIDQRALSQIVELLREVEGAAAVSHSWSALKRAEITIRLSRFGITK